MYIVLSRDISFRQFKQVFAVSTFLFDSSEDDILSCEEIQSTKINVDKADSTEKFCTGKY